MRNHELKYSPLVKKIVGRNENEKREEELRRYCNDFTDRHFWKIMIAILIALVLVAHFVGAANINGTPSWVLKNGRHI